MGGDNRGSAVGKALGGKWGRGFQFGQLLVSGRHCFTPYMLSWDIGPWKAAIGARMKGIHYILSWMLFFLFLNLCYTARHILRVDNN